jgi:gliding motility-associated-like protein
MKQTKPIFYLLLLFFCFSGFAASAQLTAGFTAAHVSGCAPLVDTFFNTTSPSTGTTYVWDLGNGSGPITLTNPSGTYLTPGTYTVTLTATNGSLVSVYTMTITVYPNPTISFTAAPNPVCPGTPVVFTSTTTGGVPGPISTTWAFGDGGSGTGTPITHTYAASGFYPITLSAINAEGCHATLVSPAYIHVVERPVASFSATPTHFCNPPGNVTFTSTPTGTGPFTYLWNFGDGSAPSTLPNPTHSYLTTGSFTVKLKIVDAAGCVDSLTIPNYIVISNLVAAFTHPDTACVNSVVTFPNTSSPHSSSVWTYGDGGSSGSETGSHSYGTAGTYNVTLVVFDGFCHDTIVHPIVIVPAAVATFTITPAQPCPAPATATFTATTPAGCTVSWLYGDGGTGTGNPTTHTYGSNGIFTVRMIVTNSHGCIDTFTQTYKVYDLIFRVHRPVDTTGCVPKTISFSTDALTSVPGPGLSPYPYPIASYSWNFGDGAPPSTSPTPSHTYTAPGVYTVTVTILTANGCPATATITVIVGTPPVITFTGSPLHLCYRDNLVSFLTTIISGPVDYYHWYFNDGTEDSTSLPGITHHFRIPGLFTITVIPSYLGCPGPPVTISNYVLIDSPKAIMHATVLCDPAKRVNFIDSSMGDDSHLWIFGDGTTSTVANPVHDYPLPIPYTVKLATYNASSGCRDTAIMVIDLSRPVVTFSTPDTTICKDSSALFVATVTGGSASFYRWHSGGVASDSSSATYNPAFHTRGLWTVTLIIEDQNGCYDTATKVNYMLVARPTLTVGATPISGCVNFATSATGTITDVTGTTYTNYSWTFGDGYSIPSGSATAGHTYTAAGTYTITETVTDNVGCVGSGTVSVTAYKPHAAFSATNVHPCLNTPITFNNSSTATTGSLWSFGDGDTSTATSPPHSYSDTGFFSVKLIITDSHGCKDTATYPNYIHVTKPTASFYMDDSIAICPPLTVHFHNTSLGATTYNWSMGDGGTSVLANPSDLYITPGYDTVRLIAVNAYGCRDTAYGHVNIFGYAGAFNYTPDSGCVPLTVFFTAHITNVPSITWDFADGYTSAVSMRDTISHTYFLPGAYVPKLILSDNTGCQNSSVGLDTIKVDGVTPGFVTNPNPVCLGQTINLVDTSKSFWSTITAWDWTYDGTSSSLPSPSVTYTAVGVYPVTLRVTDAWGCSALAAQNVTVYLPPTITVSPDTTICVGDAATLVGYGGVSYTWAGPGILSCTNCNPMHPSPTVVSQYTVTGTDAVGCTGWDTTSVFLKTMTVSHAWGDTQVCLGFTVPLYDTGGTMYRWEPATGLSNPNIADPFANPATTTTYMAIAKLAGCDPDTSYVTVVIYPLPTVDAGPSQNLLAGSVAQLQATGTLIHKYLWTPSKTLNCDTCYNPVASMSVNTTYTIKVTTIHGCIASDTVSIRLFCDNSQLFIPNSFTPNGDGQNDIFYPRGNGVSEIKSFRIYNRWGEKLFERSGILLNDASNAWDGSYNGAPPRPDVYVWIIDALCETGEPLFLKGDVTIIK